MNISERYIKALYKNCGCFRYADRFIDRNQNPSSLYVAVGKNPVGLPRNYRPDRAMNSRAVAVGYQKARPEYIYVGYRIGRSAQTPEGRRLEQAIRLSLGEAFEDWSGVDDDWSPNYWPLFREFHLGSGVNGVDETMLELICDSYCTLLEAVTANFR